MGRAGALPYRRFEKSMKFLLILALAAAPLALQASNSQVINGVAVIVNDAVITYKDIQKEVLRELEFIRQLHAGQPARLEQKLRELEEKYLEELVEKQLILHEYKTSGFKLPESYIENKINEDAKKYGDRLTLTKTLQAQGITFETYRNQEREKIILALMWQYHVPRDPVVSPHKIQVYYEENQHQFQVEDQVKLRMILIPNNENDSGSSPRKLMEEARLKIQEGVPFEEMARIYSHGSRRESGGDWGWVDRSFLREDLAEAAFSLSPGELSEIIEAEDGCYLILVEEAKKSHVKPLAEVHQEIESTLKDQEKSRLRKKWIDRLKSKSFVRYY
jgi:peptidyl-prolyl cis-trans isomerase SurA